jgi:hypothetical protein
LESAHQGKIHKKFKKQYLQKNDQKFPLFPHYHFFTREEEKKFLRTFFTREID